jgi:hypothetical protein
VDPVELFSDRLTATQCGIRAWVRLRPQHGLL